MHKTDRSFDCAARKLAYEYAKTLRPDKGDFLVVHEGLQLSGCGVALSGTPAPAPARPPPATGAAAAAEFFVSVNGSDGGGSGTLAAPFATPHRGIAACRGASAAGAPCTVTLRGGMYLLGDNPVQLTSADSGLTLQSFSGESAELSGGESLSGLAWRRATINNGRNGTSVPAVWVAPFRSVFPSFSEIFQ